MEWKELQSLVDRKIGYGVVQPGASVPNGVPVIKVNNIISGLTDISELDTTAPEIAEKYKRTKLNGGELVISVVGTYGKTAIVPKSFAGCNLVRATCLIDIVDEMLCKWVKYYIDSPKGQAYINGNLNTTVQATLNVKCLNEMPIPFYSHEYMDKVVRILSSLDRKIELNTKINATLEEMAQALFKSWFVDFEPFKNGNFIETEIGKIPEGWRVAKAEDVYKINIGKTPPRKEPQWFSKDSTDNVWVSIADMGSCGAFISDSSEYLTDEAVNKHNVIMVDEGTVLLSFKLTIGRVAIAATRLTTNEAIARFILPDASHLEFLYLCLKQYNYAALGSTSSIATAVNSKTIKAMPLLIPSDRALQEFSTIVAPMFERIKKLSQETFTLTHLRDTLLPRLMAGEIEL